MAEIKDVMSIYCDGGCRGNGRKDGVGGYGVVIDYKNRREEHYGFEVGTTNNRMELIACIESLKYARDKKVPVVVTTDSKYVVEGLNTWRHDWEKRGWMSKRKEPIKNKELWVTLIELVDSFEHIEINHCYGHSTTEGNNRADELANKAMDLFEDL